MGQGKDHMKARRINDFGAVAIDPDFLRHGLAEGIVTVAAGIIMEFHMPVAATLAGIDTKPSGLAV